MIKFNYSDKLNILFNKNEKFFIIIFIFFKIKSTTQNYILLILNALVIILNYLYQINFNNMVDEKLEFIQHEMEDCISNFDENKI